MKILALLLVLPFAGCATKVFVDRGMLIVATSLGTDSSAKKLTVKRGKDEVIIEGASATESAGLAAAASGVVQGIGKIFVP